MKCYINTTDFQIDEPTVLTIGKFDGEHIGHQKIFSQMRKYAEAQQLKTAVFTFHTAPSAVLGEKESALITTNAERNRKFESFGIDYLVEYPFNKEISMMQGEEFLRDILIAKMKMKAIVAGADCAFGYQKSGNTELLQRFADELGYRVCIIEKERDQDQREISSSLIRAELEAGNIEKANRLLGRRFSIQGRVSRGNQIGKKLLGFPTLNLFPEEDKFLPKYGVYYSVVRIEGEKGFWHGITNIGINPTVKKDRKKHVPRVETYLYDFEGDLYGKDIEVFLCRFLREEMKFDSMEALRERIELDKKEGEALFIREEELDNHFG